MDARDILRRLLQPFGWRRLLLLADVIFAGVAYLLLLFILLDIASSKWALTLTSVAVLCSAPALILFHAHAQVWRRVTLGNLIALLLAAATVSVVVGGVALLIYPPYVVIRIFIGSVIMLAAAWAGPRVLVRMWREWQETSSFRTRASGEPIILYGSGARADLFLRGNQESQKYRVLGFLHDDPRLQGARLRGVHSFGSLANLPQLIEYAHRSGYQPKRLLISEDNERPDELRAALEAAAAHGLRLSRLPGLNELVERGAAKIRPVSIDDILHREQVRLNDDRVPPAIRGATILVTGAGGSIGSELVRQISGFSPSLLVLLEASEFNLYRIDAELARTFPNIPRVTALCDVRDEAALNKIFVAHNPKVVLHAAALKHVPLLEDHAREAIMTNVIGTYNVATVAAAHNVDVVTLVSTDKAVNPTNVMGCTKRWAEIICQAYDAERRAGRIKTRFVCVRFGNVLDSAGSVVPLFREQIAMGGPITVTHEEVTRYFMTIPEACELILTATAATRLAEPEDSHVYVLDMGEPIRIMSLAERMIQLHGLRPGDDIAIEVIGLRNGEKLYEELAHEEEDLLPAPIGKANLVRSRAPRLSSVEKAIGALSRAAETGLRPKMINALRKLVPEFTPDTLTPADLEPTPSQARSLAGHPDGALQAD